MLNIAANISVLFRELPLLERFSAARAAGFDGVEMQYPYIESADSLARAARAAAAPVILMNAPVMPPEYSSGIACRPEMQHVFRAQLPQIKEYALALGVRFVHVLAGHMSSVDDRDRCRSVYIDNLLFAADSLNPCGVQVLIEPLNRLDVPSYMLGSFADAQTILDRCEGRVGLQFDVYHAARMRLDPAVEFEKMLPLIRHVQFADDPGRHEPGTGRVNFESFIAALGVARYSGWLGAEYLPMTTTAAGLKWLASWHAMSP
jgi:hydroxypyruvate isomerase